ncbi:MAG TPA: hypothetical protein VN605_09515 [Thermoanaerobaculia bacterium]|nr:hypothetical protein [Thermoanaerobaculia bacterium]
MNRLLHLFLAVATALVLATGAAADAPRFLVESISIDGARWSAPRILIAESKLVPGRTYTEAELHDALLRVQRLPFVLHADLRLQRGTERGKYVVVIAVEETKPVFISYRSLFEAIDTQRLVGLLRDPETGQFIPILEKELFRHNEETPSIGARAFVGAKGVVSASVDLRGDDTYTLGYTQYDLFGTRASAALFVKYHGYGFDLPDVFDARGRRTTSFSDHLVWDFTGALPLAGNHAIRLSWHRERQPYQVNPFGDLQVVRITYDHPQLAWVYNSTNDLLLPTSGTYIEAGLDSKKLTILRETDPVPPRTAAHYRSEYRWDHELAAQARRYWELSPSQSISAGASGFTLERHKYQQYQLQAMYSAELFEGRRASRLGDVRFELEADRNLLHYSDHSSYGTLRAGLALRNAWGIARLDFQYLGWRHRP